MKGDISDFIKYSSTGFVDQLKEQLKVIQPLFSIPRSYLQSQYSEYHILPFEDPNN